MEPAFIQAGYDNFIVHFQDDGTPDHKMRWSGTATEIFRYEGGGWNYRSNTSSETVERREDARVWFEWSFCWRGVWEGRIYFKDDEYWSEDLEAMPILWNEIQAIVKERIKADNPDYDYFD